MFLGTHITVRKPATIFLLVIMITSLIFGNLLVPYKTAQATLPTFDYANAVWNALKYAYDYVSDAISQAYEAISSAAEEWMMQDGMLTEALQAAWDILRKQLMAMLVNNVVDWIQGGGGPTRGITNWQDFLKKAVDNAAGQFVNEYLGMGFLCDRFDAKLKIALIAIPRFDTSVACPLSMMQANVNQFLQDFSNGGWKSWIQISETPNNMYGAYLMALDEKIGIEGKAQQASQNEGVASSGFLGEKMCTEVNNVAVSPLRENAVTPNTCTHWEIITPGQSLAEAAFKATDLDIDWMINATELKQYFATIVNAVVNRVIRQGLFLLQPTTQSGSSAMPSSSGLQSSITGSSVAQPVTSALSQLATSLTTYIGHLQGAAGGTGGTIQAQLQSLYSANLNLFTNMLQLHCVIPVEVTPSQSIVSSVTVSDCATTCPCTSTTTEVISASAVAVGTVNFQRITVQVQGEPDMTGMSPCLSVPVIGACPMPIGIPMATCSTNVAFQVISQTVATSAFLTTASTTSPLTAAQNMLNQVNSAISLVQAYQQEANNYLTLSQSTSTTQAQLDAADTTLTAAEAKAVAALQAITGSHATSMTTLLSSLQSVVQQIAQADAALQAQSMQAQTTTCPAQPNTIEYDFCVAQGTNYYLNQYYSICTAGGGGGSSGG